MELFANKDWDHLAGTYSWVRDMVGVPQDPRHHAEGDVAIHTRMVIDALTAMPSYQRLDTAAKEQLWTAALMHDIEKRSTTFTEPDGSIVSPGHAKKGAMTVRQLLYAQFDLPFATREQIVNLVRYHGLPLWLMHKPDPLKALLGASLTVNIDWLAKLAMADVYGRICADQAEMLDRIRFFEAYAEEQQCFGTPACFETDAARFHYFSKEGADRHYVPFEEDGFEVVMLSGLPGMGKDHYARKHFSNLPVVSLDEIRVRHKLKASDKSASGWVAQQAREEARIFLRLKRPFVWNATNTQRQMRSQLISLFTSYGAQVRIVYIEKPYRQWRQQNQAREASVPAPVLQRLLDKLEVPDLTEAHRVDYIVP